MAETLEVRRDGLTLDLLLFERYGTTNGLELVLAANPGLAALGAVLPLLTKVYVPELPAPEPRQVVRLWGP